MTIAAHKDLINMSIGQNIARLYYKGASDSEVLRHCQRMQRRYLDAAAAITLEVKLSGEDDAPRGHATARRSNILSAMMWRDQGRMVKATTHTAEGE